LHNNSFIQSYYSKVKRYKGQLLSHNQSRHRCSKDSRCARKVEYVLGEDQFGFKSGKGTREEVGVLRIISERTLDIDEKLCTCYIDREKALDRVTWAKLMQIVKEIGID
jgi:hypothetical protein